MWALVLVLIHVLITIPIPFLAPSFSKDTPIPLLYPGHSISCNPFVPEEVRKFLGAISIDPKQIFDRGIARTIS